MTWWPFIFPTRDGSGNESTVTATPTAVSADRTRAQVVVPDLAQTGPVTLSSSSARSELGFWTSYPDAIYRDLTERFTPSAGTLRGCRWAQKSSGVTTLCVALRDGSFCRRKLMQLEMPLQTAPAPTRALCAARSGDRLP